MNIEFNRILTSVEELKEYEIQSAIHIASKKSMKMEWEEIKK